MFLSQCRTAGKTKGLSTWGDKDAPGEQRRPDSRPCSESQCLLPSHPSQPTCPSSPFLPLFVISVWLSVLDSELTWPIQPFSKIYTYKDMCFYFNFLLAYNCFTILYLLVPYNNVNRLYVYIYPLPLELPASIPLVYSLQSRQAETPVL